MSFATSSFMEPCQGDSLRSFRTLPYPWSTPTESTPQQLLRDELYARYNPPHHESTPYYPPHYLDHTEEASKEGYEPSEGRPALPRTFVSELLKWIFLFNVLLCLCMVIKGFRLLIGDAVKPVVVAFMVAHVFSHLWRWLDEEEPLKLSVKPKLVEKCT